MFKKLMKYLTGFKKLSEDKAKEELAQMSDEEKQKLAQEAEEKEKVSMKKHLVEVEKMSEEDADKKLAEMKPEEKEELACKMKEHEEKLVGEAAQKEKDQRETQMSAFKEKVTRLSTELKGTSEKVRLAHKKTQLMTRFSKLRSEAKVTPAEIKKIDFDRLSKCNQETIDAVLKSYEDREMTIFTGALGTQKAMTHTQLQESLKGERMSALEAETRKNMPTKRMAEGDQKVGGEAAKEVEVHIDTAPHVAYEKEYEELSRLVDEDKKDEIKDKLKKLFEGLKKSGLASDSTSVPTEGEAEKQMASLAEDVKKLQSVVEELVKMTQATN